MKAQKQLSKERDQLISELANANQEDLGESGKHISVWGDSHSGDWNVFSNK